jgi:hypothetical protein
MPRPWSDGWSWVEGGDGMTGWGSRHATLVIWIRIGIGIWLAALAAVFGANHDWWGLLLLLPAALHFYLAGRVYRATHR